MRKEALSGLEERALEVQRRAGLPRKFLGGTSPKKNLGHPGRPWVWVWVDRSVRGVKGGMNLRHSKRLLV